jgi:hypothetical protein
MLARETLDDVPDGRALTFPEDAHDAKFGVREAGGWRSGHNVCSEFLTN